MMVAVASIPSAITPRLLMSVSPSLFVVRCNCRSITVAAASSGHHIATSDQQSTSAPAERQRIPSDASTGELVDKIVVSLKCIAQKRLCRHNSTLSNTGQTPLNTLSNEPSPTGKESTPDNANKLDFSPLKINSCEERPNQNVDVTAQCAVREIQGYPQSVHNKVENNANHTLKRNDQSWTLISGQSEHPKTSERFPKSIETTENEKLEQYDFLRKLGSGMIGRVYLVSCKSSSKKLMAMKIMPKQKVINLHQVEHVQNERDILSSGISHPFIVSLFDTFADEDFLYLVMEYLPGKELYHYICQSGRFSLDTARFYSMQTISAIGYLHSKSIIYRDLKPENIMLDRNGNLKLVDFGFSKKVTHSTWTLCGTPKYLAPEIILSKAYTKAVDWWTVGILIYEMLTGNPPFNSSHMIEVCHNIVSGRILWPSEVFDSSDDNCTNAKDCIQKLLIRDPRKRLGTNRNGFIEIKRQRWFKPMNWDTLEKMEYQAPIIPQIFSVNSTDDSSMNTADKDRAQQTNETIGQSRTSMCRWKSSIMKSRIDDRAELDQHDFTNESILNEEGGSRKPDDGGNDLFAGF